MKWTVVWKPVAENNLASLWAEAAPEDRHAITLSADAIDRELRRSPQELGESRSGIERAFLLPPLAVLFEVSPQDCMVVVINTWRIPYPP